jgi:large subunit ribosomal protein L15
MSYPILKDHIIKHRKRYARGNGSGRGGTSGRGHKGQKARTGKTLRPYFESGAIELYRRLPKVNGFTRHWVKKAFALNISKLNHFDTKEVVNLASLKAKNLIPATAVAFKLLSKGELDKALTIETDLYTKQAKAKLDKAGCKFASPKIDDSKAKINPVKAKKTPPKKSPKTKK